MSNNVFGFQEHSKAYGVTNLTLLGCEIFQRPYKWLISKKYTLDGVGKKTLLLMIKTYPAFGRFANYLVQISLQKALLLKLQRSS